MNNSYDGKSFKRTPNRTGEKTPVVGFRKERAVYTAQGGETSINLSTLNPPLRNIPGQNLITIKRTTQTATISGVHFHETGPYGINLTSPLVAGEIVELTREAAVVGVMALSVKPDVYTQVATAGQTEVQADFYWPYMQQPSKSRGAVRVEVDGVAKDRGVHYNEVAISGQSQTHIIQFINPLVGGERITLQPTNQVVDNSIPNGATHAAEITTLKNRVTSLEANSTTSPTSNIVRIQYPGGSDYTTSSTVMVDVPNASSSFTLNHGNLDMNFLIKVRYSNPYYPTDVGIEVVVLSGTNIVYMEEIYSGGLFSDGRFTNVGGHACCSLPPGTYTVKVRWKTFDGQSVSMSAYYKISLKQVGA